MSLAFPVGKIPGLQHNARRRLSGPSPARPRWGCGADQANFRLYQAIPGLVHYRLRICAIAGSQNAQFQHFTTPYAKNDP